MDSIDNSRYFRFLLSVMLKNRLIYRVIYLIFNSAFCIDESNHASNYLVSLSHLWRYSGSISFYVVLVDCQDGNLLKSSEDLWITGSWAINCSYYVFLKSALLRLWIFMVRVKSYCALYPSRGRTSDQTTYEMSVFYCIYLVTFNPYSSLKIML